jgi:KDO2-lipid IV(A) lauroyltransferase
MERRMRINRPGCATEAWVAIQPTRSRGGDVALLEMEAAGGRAVVGALREGRRLVVLMDQNAREREGVFAPFFGAPACTRRGPVAIAVRRRLPILPIFIERQGAGLRHRVRVMEPLIMTQPADDSKSALAATVRDEVARLNAVLEVAVRRRPEEWIWSHRRFKTQPERGVDLSEMARPPSYPSRHGRRHPQGRA